MSLYREWLWQMRQPSFYSAVVITLLCSLGGKYLATWPGLSLVGHLVLALLLGMMLQVWSVIPAITHGGTNYISNRFLRLGIILLGFKLNISLLLTTGLPSLVAACIVVPCMIVLTYRIARRLHTDPTLALLTACGCGICGAAAVVGVAGPARAKPQDTVVAIAVVCILGTVFSLIEVLIQPWLGLSEYQFGVMAGMTLHEIAHAVAAGSAAGEVGLDAAVVTKLARVLLLAPVALVIAHYARRHAGGDAPIQIPYFIGGFVLTSILGTITAMSAEWLSSLVSVSYLLLGMAMAALGMGVNFGVVIRNGRRPLAAAAISSAVLLAAGLGAVTLWF